MGYTNSFHFKKTLIKFPKAYIEDIKKAVDYTVNTLKIPLKVGSLDEQRIDINGVEPHHCENLYVSTVYEDDVPADPAHKVRYGIDCWRFCKTSREPYDVIVKACLILAEKYQLLEKKFEFGGNRRENEYRRAYRMCRKLDLI